MDFAMEIPVRFGDTDPYGVVYFATYFRWAHTGVEEFLLQAGLRPEETFRSEEPRFGLPVVEASGRFVAPARYGEKLSLTVSLSSLDEKSATFSLAFQRPADGTRLGEATVTCVAIGADWKAIPIPDHVRQRLKAASGDD